MSVALGEVVKNWTVGQLAALVHKLGAETARAILRGEAQFKIESLLIRGLFAPTEAQVLRWQEWLPGLREQHAVTVSDEAFNTFITGKPVPAWPDNKLTALALTLRGPSAAREFQIYWPLIAAQQERSWKWDDLKFDDDHIRWLNGSGNEQKAWRFEWQVIDLGANRKTSSETVRQAHGDKPLPNVGILAAAALHPTWIKSMNGRDVPYVDLPGYEVSVPGYRPWRRVPSLYFNRDPRRVRLDTDGCDDANPGWGVPALAREC